MKIGVVVTGLPASGKTTIARSIGKSISLQLLDKDDFLEDLYDVNNVRTWEDRKALSRQSDSLFQSAAEAAGSAVLVSHWRPLGEHGESGTPTDWLNEAYEHLIEVCCVCAADTALNRFLARKRHPGHFDQMRDPVELARRMKSWENRYPIGIGSLIEVHTDSEVNQNSVFREVQRLMDGGHSSSI